MQRWLVAFLGWTPIGAWAASPADRMKGVASYAKDQSDGGPDHLVVGLGVVLGCTLLIALGAALRSRRDA